MVFVIDLIFYTIVLLGIIFFIEAVGKAFKDRWFKDELDAKLVGSIREYLYAEEEFSEDFTQLTDITRVRLARAVVLQNLKGMGYDLYERTNPG